VLRQVLLRHGIDPDPVFDEVATGAPLKTFRHEHEQAAARHGAFGVPTLVVDERAVFLRLLHRPGGDGDEARRTVERLLELSVDWPELNELKHTTIPPSLDPHRP
jgi:hypothetical protein